MAKSKGSKSVRTTGHYVTTTTVGAEPVRAFVPSALPPTPALDITPELRELLDRALLAVGRLDSVTSLLPNPKLYLYLYVRKEAVLSSQIEGTQSSLTDLLAYEHDVQPGVPLDDVTEVSNYVAALDHGLTRMREDFPLSGRLLRSMHKLLLRSGRGSHQQPGEYRRSQNWIGGSRPGNARFVPPPPDQVADCMAALERFIHDETERTPVLIKAALAHVQFETIHPFLDGNGRIGRLLIVLILCHEGVLREPLLYLSLYFKEHRQEYYERLDAVRTSGDWELWLGFFCQAVIHAAESAVQTTREVAALFARDREHIHARLSAKNASTALRIHDVLQANPVCTVADIMRATSLTSPTVNQSLQRLIEIQIVRELTGRSRNRLFGYDRYVQILNEGTERPF